MVSRAALPSLPACPVSLTTAQLQPAVKAMCLTSPPGPTRLPLLWPLWGFVLQVLPGLYLCGEVLDVFGRIGGFNFWWAWLTGRLAGTAAGAAAAADAAAGQTGAAAPSKRQRL